MADSLFAPTENRASEIGLDRRLDATRSDAVVWLLLSRGWYVCGMVALGLVEYLWDVVHVLPAV